jgi:ribonucleoside-triphosphate reductase
MRVSAKRLFPNYTFLDSPYNLQYYVPGRPETEVATMGCRTRVMGNVYDPSRQIAYSRGNLSFTSINLPRLAIESKGDEKLFYEKLEAMLELVAQQLLDRFEIQANKHIYNYPFLMGQGVWLDSDHLTLKDDLREVLKHGTLSIGFIGLAETLTALYGQHHGTSEELQEKGLEIIGFMRNYCDNKSKEMQMNITLLGTPAEGLSGRFIRMDQKRYGKIPGVTDREYYTNSFHIPVWYNISGYDKIRLEAPYHALCNAGHISYVELDGDTARNVEAFEAIVRCMHDHGIGYGSINHPVDRDPICGYVGIIGDVCPRCGRREGEEIDPERIEELRRMYPQMPAFQGIE